MSRKALSLLGSAAFALVGVTALTGCGVSPAYTPVRTAVVPEPMPVETAPAPAQPVENAAYDDTDPAALTDFHDTLAPYGSWEEDATYGTVWVPSRERVGGEFAPYKTAGHWELDQNEEWLWVSDYDDTFGWVVFHYGRWTHTEARGWVWIPGRRYAPAWVAWQTGDPGYGYVGWAAMPPAYYWHSGAVVWLDVYPAPYYVYCPTSYVFYHDWHSHAVPHHHVVAVATPMRPYGTPRGGGRVYAQPHQGPSARTGHVPPGSYPTSRHAMSDGQRRYAVPSSPATAGNGLGGSPRAGSRSRPQSFDAPGGAERGPGRAIGGADGPASRSSFAGGPDVGPSRSSSAFSGRGAPPVAAPPGRSSSAFEARPSSSPPVARVPDDGPTRMPSHGGPTPASGAFARPSSPGSSGPVQAPSRPSAFSSPTRSAPSPSPVSAPSRAPSSSFSPPSRSSSSSFSTPTRSSSPSFSAPSRASSPAVSSPSRSSSSSGSVSRPSAPSGGSRGRR